GLVYLLRIAQVRSNRYYFVAHDSHIGCVRLAACAVNYRTAFDEKVEAHNLSFAYANFESPTYPEEALQCQVSLSRRLMVDLEANTIEFVDQEPYGLMV
ncbi:MAG: hypothetical protein DWQ28_05220, partial [Proteobacteria bacterium]